MGYLRRVLTDGAFVAFLVLVLLPVSLCALGKDPRKVYVLYTGDPYPGVTPYIPMREDAFIEVTAVQGSRDHWMGISWEDIHRSVRLYMPRTYRTFVDYFDVVILSDTNRRIFTADQHFWLKNGVLQEGMGLVMVGGLETFGAGFGYESWSGSPVEDVLPVTIPTSGQDWLGGGAPIKITPEGYSNPFIASLPYRPLPEYMRIGTDGNIVYRKEGSTLLAYWSSAKYDNPPCYVTWEIEKARTYAMMHDWTPNSGWIMSRWAYYGDYAINLMLYLAKRPLPTDPVIVHEYRQLIHTLAIGKGTLFSLVDFVEGFGGNARPILKEMGVFDQMVADAKEEYLNSDFNAALLKAQKAGEKLKEIDDLAVKVKNSALMWVYVIEWLSVSGVSLVSGALMWSLMVKRKMYRDVGSTRGITR